MSRYIENMRNRPEHHQRVFALTVAGGFTLVLFGIWSFVMVNKPDTVASDQNTNSLAAVVSSDQTPTDNSNQTDTSNNEDQPGALQNFQTGVQNAYNDIQSNTQSPTSAYQDARNTGLNNGQ
jgi:hypothetical protein